MRSSRRSWWRWHRQEQGDIQAETSPTAPDKAADTAKEVEELKNEIAELRQELDELRLQVKESEARLGTVEDDSQGRARTLDMVLEWCQEQEAVLAQHRDVVAAMGAAARALEKDASIGGLESEVEPHDEQPPA